MRNETSPQKATFESVWALIQENAKETNKLKEYLLESQRVQEEERKKREEERKKREEERKKREIEWKKERDEFRKSVRDMQIEIGGISNSNGQVTESYFINSFEQNLQFAGQKYDGIIHNYRQKSKKLNLQGEYDLVLYNGSSVVIIEIKYKARERDVVKLMSKASTFKQLFPHYANYDMFLGLAAFHFEEQSEQKSIDEGIAVIKQNGDNMVINDAHLKNYK